MPPGHVAALAGTDAAPRAVLEVDEVYLPRVLDGHRGRRRRAASTCRATSWTGPTRCAWWPAAGGPPWPRRRTPTWSPTPTTRWWSGPPASARDVHWVGAGTALAARCCRLPLVRGAHRVRRGGRGPARGCGFARPVAEATLVRRARTGRRWPSGPTGDAARCASRCPAGSTRPTRCMAAVAAEACGVDAAGRARGHGVRWRRWPAASPCAASVACGPGSCWPRTRPGGTSCSTWWRRSDAPLVGEHQRPGRGRRRSELAVGRALRAPGRPPASWRTGDRCRDLSVRLQYAGVAHADGGRPGRTAVAAGTAARSDDVVDVIGNYTAFHDSSGRRHERSQRAAAGRGGLPRSAGHLRRRGQRADPGPAGPVARPRGRAAAGRRRTAAARGRHLLPGRRRGRPPGAGRRGRCIDDGMLARRVARGRSGPGRVRRLPGGRAGASRAPTGEPHEGVGLLDVDDGQGGGPAGGGRGAWPNPTRR